jgi:hypothetical protein
MSRNGLLRKSVTSIIVATVSFSCNSRVDPQTQSQVNAQQNPQPSIVYGETINYQLPKINYQLPDFGDREGLGNQQQ